MRKNPSLLCLIFLFLLDSAVFSASSASAEWPCFGGPNHDGKSPDRGLLKEWPPGGPKLLWQADGIGEGFSSVTVSGGTVYITGDRDDRLVLFAFDMQGKPRWQVPIDKAWTQNHNGSRSSATIDGGKLYLLSGHGLIGCYDARTGKPRWARKTSEFDGKSGGWGYAESVLIYKNLAIVKPGGSKCIAALDKSTGRTVWTSSGFSAGPEYGSCLPIEFKGGHLIATGTREGLVCVDARNGRKLWLNDFSRNNTANCPTPAYADGHVFWANGYGKGGICMKMNVAGGKLVAGEAWRTRDMVCHHGGYVIHEGHIYGNNSGGWSCLDLKTGRQKWNERGVGKGSLCWADGMMYLFSDNGGRVGLATCSPDGMEMKGQFSVEGRRNSWAHPVVIGGRLYIRYDTHLYCFDVKA